MRQNVIHFSDLFRSKGIKGSISCRYDSESEEDEKLLASRRSQLTPLIMVLK